MNNDNYGLYIPYEILDNRKLKAVEKLVFSVIYGMCKNMGGSCFPSVRYIADKLRITANRTNQAILELEKDGYIIIRNDEGKRKIFFNQF